VLIANLLDLNKNVNEYSNKAIDKFFMINNYKLIVQL